MARPRSKFCRIWLMALTSLTAAAPAPYPIDVVLPLSGPGAFLGTAEQTALQRFEATQDKAGIGGRPVHFVFHDDQSSPQVAVQLASQIVADKPPVVIGSALVAACNAMAPLMRRGPVMYCTSPGVYPPAGSFMFSASHATIDSMSTLVRFFRLKRMTRIALITSTDATGQDALRNAHEVFARPENKEMQLVIETSFNPTDVSASAQIQRIKGSAPQAVIAWATGSATGTVFKAIADAGIDVPVATTNGNMLYAAMRQFADILPRTLYMPSPEWPQSDKLAVPPPVAAAKEAFFAAYQGTGIQPDAASTFAWDPAVLVVNALRTLGPDATAEQLRAALAASTGVAGVAGVYDFPKAPQRGLDDSTMVVTLWDAAAQRWAVVSQARGVPFE